MLATPVTHDGKVYCLTGQEPDHCQGKGNLVCFDATGKEVWSYPKINRSMSTVAIGDGLLFACDAARAGELEEAFRGESEPLWSIGEALDGRPGGIRID